MVLLMFAAPGMAYQLTVHNGRITLQADQVRLRTLMNDLAEKTEIKVYITPGLNPHISANFDNQDLESSLKLFLTQFNHALKWETIRATDTSEGLSEASPIRLAEIHIFKEGRQHKIQPPEKNPPLNVARNPEDGSLYVRGEILIRLKPGMDLRELNETLKKFGGTLILENSNLGIYRIKLPDQTNIPELVKQINDYPGIEAAEPNYAYPIALPHRYLPDSEIKAKLELKPRPDGLIPIAILDSGLAPGNLPEEYLLATRDAFDPDTPISDPLGHGTQMALVAAGIVTPFGAEKNTDSANPLIAIRTFDENGYTSSTALMRGIDYALANGAKVASLSWGSTTKSSFMNDTLEYGAEKGLIIVASAGNKPTGEPVFPAAYDSVIGIGALSPDGKNWENSNYGDFVDLYLPGFADMPVGYKAEPGIYAGTSISAAFAANRIAAFLAKNPRAGKQEISAFLSNVSNGVKP